MSLQEIYFRFSQEFQPHELLPLIFLVCISILQRLAQECSSQFVDSHRYTPHPLPAVKPDANTAETQSYSQYVSTVKSQVSCAREIHDAMLDCSNKLGENRPT